MNVLLVSPDPGSRHLLRLAVGSIERRLETEVGFLEASDGESGARIALRERPDVVIADEIASRAGAFALARTLRGEPDPFRGVIAIVLERRQDVWLARWSGADLWFVKPVDPFELADRVAEMLTAETNKETA